MKDPAILLSNRLLLIPDPRVSARVRYPLRDILFLTVAAVMAGCEGWDEIEDFAADNLQWLRKYTTLEDHSPSADTIRRVFSRVSPKAFREAFSSWVIEVFGTKIGDHIAIDGKCIKGSARSGKGALTLLSAFATGNGICLGQYPVEAGSNEIKAIPKLLDQIDVKGSLVSIDAIACQVDIVKKVVQKEADYLIAIKKNQKLLHQDVKESFAHFAEKFKLDLKEFETKETGHGRQDHRRYTVVSEVNWMPESDRWPGIKSIVRAISNRTTRGKTSTETRYFISSSNASASKLGTAIRRHWGIENKLHWVLDVAFNEDSIGIHDRRAAENLGLVRKIALALTKEVKPKNMSYRRQGKRYSRRPDLLFEALSNQLL